jgi:acyl carrier protein
VISDRLKKVILRELRLSDAHIVDTSVASDVTGWDSLNHVRILTAIENEFSVRIRPLEAIRLKTVGDLQRLVDSKTAKP